MNCEVFRANSPSISTLQTMRANLPTAVSSKACGHRGCATSLQRKYNFAVSKAMGLLLTAAQDLTVVSYCGDKMILCQGRKAGFSRRKCEYLRARKNH